MDRRTFLQTLGAAAAGGWAHPRVASADLERAARPNLLIIMTDQQRWDALSRAGNRVLSTPNLDRLAQEGAFFKAACCACPVCVPSRTSMLTGHSIHTTRVVSNQAIRDPNTCEFPTYDEILVGAGYTGKYLGKWHAPVPRGRCYEKPVTMAGMSSSELGEGLRAHYLTYLDAHVPARPVGEGELVDRGSNRPYRPDPLDTDYGAAPPDPKEERERRKRSSEADHYGCLEIPAHFSRTAFTADETMAAIEQLADKPFTITCSFGPPHPPMIVPRPYYGMYPASDMPVPESIDDPMQNSPYASVAAAMTRYRDRSKIGFMISDYYGLVKEVDDHVGRILDKLRSLGLEKKTLVVFTSDHGEMLGAHGMREKNVFYEEAVRVPLILRWPGVIAPGTEVSYPVSQVSLFATILDYLGLDRRPSHGESLRKVIESGAAPPHDFVVSEWHARNVPDYMVRTARWKLLFFRSDEKGRLDALFDLGEDPQERNNLLGLNPRRADFLHQADEMKERLITWLEYTDSPLKEEVKARAIS